MKYRKLFEFLRHTERSMIDLTFSDLETLLGFELPASAYKYPAWWSNASEGHTHSAAWLDAGWKTSQVKLSERSVRFVRQRDDGSVEQVSGAARAGFGEEHRSFAMDAEDENSGPVPSLFGAMSGSLTVLADVDLTEPMMKDFEVSEGGL